MFDLKISYGVVGFDLSEKAKNEIINIAHIAPDDLDKRPINTILYSARSIEKAYAVYCTAKKYPTPGKKEAKECLERCSKDIHRLLGSLNRLPNDLRHDIVFSAMQKRLLFCLDGNSNSYEGLIKNLKYLRSIFEDYLNKAENLNDGRRKDDAGITLAYEVAACLHDLGIKPTRGVTGVYEKILYILFREAHYVLKLSILAPDTISDKAEVALQKLRGKLAQNSPSFPS